MLRRVTAHGCGDYVPTDPERRVKTEEQPLLIKDMELHRAGGRGTCLELFKAVFLTIC